ncbi:unnamed protein product [Caenorhabditis brenneri]
MINELAIVSGSIRLRSEFLTAPHGTKTFTANDGQNDETCSGTDKFEHSWSRSLHHSDLDEKETEFKANPSEFIYLLRVNIKKVLNVRRRDQKLILHGTILHDRQAINQAGILQQSSGAVSGGNQMQ